MNIKITNYKEIEDIVNGNLKEFAENYYDLMISNDISVDISLFLETIGKMQYPDNGEWGLADDKASLLNDIIVSSVFNQYFISIARERGL